MVHFHYYPSSIISILPSFINTALLLLPFLHWYFSSSIILNNNNCQSFGIVIFFLLLFFQFHFHYYFQLFLHLPGSLHIFSSFISFLFLHWSFITLEREVGRRERQRERREEGQVRPLPGPSGAATAVNRPPHWAARRAVRPVTGHCHWPRHGGGGGGGGRRTAAAAITVTVCWHGEQAGQETEYHQPSTPPTLATQHHNVTAQLQAAGAGHRHTQYRFHIVY